MIHNLMHWDNGNTGVINFSPHWLGPGKNRADHSKTIDDIEIKETEVEGMVNCAVRIYALENITRLRIDSFHIESWNKLDSLKQTSRLSVYNDPEGAAVKIGNQMKEHNGLSIHDYTVGGEVITKSDGNWASDKPRRLDFDLNLWDSWDCR